MGPLVSAAQRDKVEGMLERAVQAGARRIEEGSDESPGPADGYWVRPTILVDLQPEMEILHSEIFGPVTPIVPVDSLDEALALANDSEYGLSGTCSPAATT